MEIIPLLVVVLLCAPWSATGLELHIPGLGRMNLEVSMGPDRCGGPGAASFCITTGAFWSRTSIAYYNDYSKQIGCNNGGVGTVVLMGEVRDFMQIELLLVRPDAAFFERLFNRWAVLAKSAASTTVPVICDCGRNICQFDFISFIRETTTPEALEGRTEGQASQGDQTTLADQKIQNPGNGDEASDKTDNQTDAAEADQITKAGNEAVTEGSTKKTDDESAATAKGNDKTTEAGNAEQSEATKAETKKAEATTEAQTKPKDKPNKEDKKETTASTAKNSEAITETTTVKDKKAATPNPGKNLETTTEQEAVATTVKPESQEEEEDDDFDMSDVWDDVEGPPEEFGREYDLDPKLMGSGNNSSDDDFQPKLELPPDMTKDMFYDGNKNETKGVAPDEGGFFDRLKKFFSIGNLIEQLDTIPGKVQSLMDQFQQKKSSGLRSLREKMDSNAESIGYKISEAFARMKPPKHEPNAQECLRGVQESFKEYEAALQGGIEPCLEKAQSVLGKQEGTLKGAMGRFSRMLSDMQGCAQKLEGASIKEFVTSIFNVGSCTKNNIQSKIEQALQPQMQRLSELIQRQGKALQGNMDATGECIKRKLQLSKFQKQRLDLIAEGKRCLERRQ